MKLGYIEAVGIRYKNELNTIKKRDDTPLQPITEAFTNAWEAIKERFTANYIKNGSISLEIYIRSNALSKEDKKYDFEKIVVSDNGSGLNENSFQRLINLRDDSKSYNNKGTGRIQYIHSFEDTIIESIYQTDKGTKTRKITLSKKEAFLKKNAIMRVDEYCTIEKGSSPQITKVTFTDPLDHKDRDYFESVKIAEMKEKLIFHFLSRFCDNRTNLPKINIAKFIDDIKDSEEYIKEEDIPNSHKEVPIDVNYSKLDNNKITSIDKKESFILRSFLQPASKIKKNEIHLASKGEIASQIKLTDLLETDIINGCRYLFLLSGEYIDKNNPDDRGNIQLISAKQFRTQNEGSGSLFPEEVILLDDIEDRTNNEIAKQYPEINEKNIEKQKNLEELQQMFLLNPLTVETLKTKIKSTDSDEVILHKIYLCDAEIKAKQDAEIKQQIEDINSITPTDPNYQNKLKEKVDEFVKTVPLQNRTALTQYVARRKLVLNIFEKILNRELENLQKKEHINEDILHNLIFQQHSEMTSAESSDLWLINEEYIYFKGTSDCKLCDISIDGKELLKKDCELSEEELEYKMKCKQDAGDRKPDILIFPSEGKCSIIEFKAPHVDVSNHLHQINRYARLINNLSNDNYKIQTYYGYLIGENIDIDEIQDSDPTFKSASSLNYIFLPNLPVTGKFGRKDGSLYTEIIKYSDLLKRAHNRNSIFIKKLEGNTVN